ncbi:PREDICTED: caspase Dronc-like [Nicrophorus vespilloides]|uniref:Caspase Dronc-like n=1 Tax=Nicrophorus vespilloides TaxID=110193 RepID=A0ABM1N4M9_NICVS|nr:PREDICTED: caspase Dronc-like [Nicrophorus vespilloides]
MFKMFGKSKKEKNSKGEKKKIVVDDNTNFSSSISSNLQQNVTVKHFATRTVTTTFSSSGNKITESTTKNLTSQLPQSPYTSPFRRDGPFSIFSGSQQRGNSLISSNRNAFQTEFAGTNLQADARPIIPIQYNTKPVTLPLKNVVPTSTYVSPYKQQTYVSPYRQTEPKKTDFKEYNELSNALVIKVKKAKTFHDQNGGPVPVYSTHGSRRGKALLINNIMFEKDQKSYRKGAEVDEKNISELLNQMGFKVEKYRDLTKNQMVKKLVDYASSYSLKNVDINVVVMMSHGIGNNDGNTHIAGTDNNLLSIADIVEKFDNSNCPNLIDKPKIFIFQCCRGDQDQRVERDAAQIMKAKKKYNDMLLAYSTIPGYVSHRNPVLGTWYIQAICKVFMEHACDTHVEDLLKIVENMLNQLAGDSGYTQTSSYENRGFKLCYLHPK